MTTIDVPRAPRRMPVPDRPGAVRRRTVWMVATVVVVITHLVAAWQTDVNVKALVQGSSSMMEFLGEAIPPDLTWETVLKPSFEGALTTLWIGLLGTSLSIPTSVLLATLAARGTAHPAIQQAARAVLSFLRAVPDVVFALIFVTAVGLGPFAGVLALICHNTGVMGKLWAESMEESDPGPAQALATAGAGPAQRVAHATIPMVSPQWTGLLLYRFDVNVRASLVLGLVGAGGIGLLINRSIKTFQFDQMFTHIIVVLVMIVLVDLLSGWVRRRLNA